MEHKGMIHMETKDHTVTQITARIFMAVISTVMISMAVEIRQLEIQAKTTTETIKTNNLWDRKEVDDKFKAIQTQ